MSKNNMKLVPLCRCNNCMRIYEDTNPQDGAHKFMIPESVPQLELHNDMRRCPECETDEYLSDVGLDVNISYVGEEFPILNALLKWCDQGKTDAANTGQMEIRKMFIHFKHRIYKELEDQS